MFYEIYVDVLYVFQFLHPVFLPLPNTIDDLFSKLISSILRFTSSPTLIPDEESKSIIAKFLILSHPSRFNFHYINKTHFLLLCSIVIITSIPKKSIFLSFWSDIF